ncbi:MAG: hypothetical protein IKO65_10770 [Victivallales bacterium]|jgi:cell fate regulator YaaT (PSP1 superfamily)|nr:hypothetical protein [Victivallales bacterium]
MKSLYRLSINAGIAYDAVGDLSLGLAVGAQVVVQCDRYQEVARIMHVCPHPPFEAIGPVEEELRQKTKGRQIEGQHLPVIIRLAKEDDLRKVQENAQRLDEVHRRTVERIHAHDLPMKLIHEHYTFDRKLLVFQFTSENRVDFRELIRDLSTLFHCRVELRQVGVRDETSIVGGLGSCGRPFCCATFLHSIASVNVKTAKQQGLSLNPQNISGCCGRLKCCLQFEADYYHAPSRPSKEHRTGGNDEDGKKHKPHGGRQFRPPKATPPTSNDSP